MTETASQAPGQSEERHDFSAEVGRLLDLVVHALYSEREIFLRELVANAADALDRRRFEALTEPSLALPEGAKIRILPDKPGRLLTISDDGIGMSRDDLITHLGTIARSGTRAFSAEIAKARPEERPTLIGQFGVGFYSAFMVAERVEVISRRAGSEEAWRWHSEGRGEFALAAAARETPGTDVILHLKADAEEFLDPVRLEAIVRKWADHITWPVTIARDGKDLPANEGTALWRKPKAEISEQSYTEFYRHLGHLFDKPWATLHWKAEGAMEFHALLFIPEMRPFAVVEEERTSRVRLHVRRMFITDEAGLLPSWLRFVQGVVDTEDLPLNVSREMLQSTPVLGRIRNALTNRVLTELKTRAKDDEGYEKFWENFGPILKEGLWEDQAHQKDILPLARFRTTANEGWTSLADYVARMKPGQEAIYLLAGENIAALRRAPLLEGFRAAGVEVLLLADSIDAFWPDRCASFEDKPIRNAIRSGEDLAKLAPAPDAPAADVSALAAALKTALGDGVSDVRASERLVESAVALAPGLAGGDLFRERLMRRAGRDFPAPPPVLEINPRHPLITALAARGESSDLAEIAATLLDLARVQEGETPADAAAFARRVTALMAGGLAPAPAA